MSLQIPRWLNLQKTSPPLNTISHYKRTINPLSKTFTSLSHIGTSNKPDLLVQNKKIRFRYDLTKPSTYTYFLQELTSQFWERDDACGLYLLITSFESLA